MPRVVRDVIRMTRTIRLPAREPPSVLEILPLASDGNGALSPVETQAAPEEQSPTITEWQVLIVIHALPDTLLA